MICWLLCVECPRLAVIGANVRAQAREEQLRVAAGHNRAELIFSQAAAAAELAYSVCINF
jgi:hypothetical protein